MGSRPCSSRLVILATVVAVVFALSMLSKSLSNPNVDAPLPAAAPSSSTSPSSAPAPGVVQAPSPPPSSPPPQCVKELCTRRAVSAEQCLGRCGNCLWEREQCGCTASNPDLPACQDSYPEPASNWLRALAQGNVGLRPDDKIVLFGDSITWLGGYAHLLQGALNTAGLSDVRVTNLGMNGARIGDVRLGKDDVRMPPFANCLARYMPTIAIIFVGTNDVTGYPMVSYFEPDLADMVAEAVKTEAIVILSTLFVWGEDVTSNKRENRGMDAISDTIRKVASEAGVGLMDVREDVVSYEMAHNFKLPQMSGVLSVDEFHPCQSGQPPCPPGSNGNVLIANALARALIAELKKRRPTAQTN